MNREQKRGLERRLKAKGYSESDAKKYVSTAETLEQIRKFGSGEASPPKKFEEGDKVKLNIRRIRERKNYDRMLDAYKEFVNDNQDTVFTAHVEHENMISFAEEPRWLFWSGDLEHAEKAGVAE